MQPDWKKGIIAWFAENSVAANLLMLIIIVAGLFSVFTIKKEIIPRIEPNVVNITVPYLGAAPQEVEEGVLIKIEEAIQDVEGIKEIRSTAREGSGTVTVEVTSDYDPEEVLDELKLRVDSISTFPAETEKPVISRPTFQQQVLWLSVSGDFDERTLKEYAKEIRDEVTALKNVSVAEIVGTRDYEISIEVSEMDLQQYGLTFDEVVQAVRASSLDLPGGTIRAESGDILLRTKGQAYVGEDFERIVLRTRPDGSRLMLGDVATVEDGFVEGERYTMFDQKPAVAIRVLSIGNQNELDIADTVRGWVEQRQETLPEGLRLTAWADSSYYLRGRLQLMTKNLVAGAALVLLVLTLFLRLKLAFWVLVGIPISFLGAFWLMPVLGVSINMLSLFAFILVLGIVVDDAIIIGESIFTHIRRDGHTLENVVKGAKEVAIPATFGVLTTMAAFLPLLLIGGVQAAFWQAIGLVVVLCLAFSLVESKLILPTHLAHAKLKHVADVGSGRMAGVQRRVMRFQRFFSDGLERFVVDRYQPLLRKSLRQRYITLSAFVAGFILIIGLLAGGIVRQVFFPKLFGDFIQADVEMAQGTPNSEVIAATRILEAGLYEVDRQVSEEHGLEPGAIVKHVIVFRSGDLRGQVLAELVKDENSPIGAQELLNRWREEVGEIPGARAMGFDTAAGGPGGAPVAFRLVGDDFDQLSAAANELASKLRSYDGLYDIENSFEAGPDEIRLKIKPEAEALGLTLSNLARQVRQAFYGAEAQRIQRGKDEIRVMVRYPEHERRSVGDLESMRIRTPSGDEVPFSAVAEIEKAQGYSVLRRVDRQRSVTISADADLSRVEPGQIVKEIMETFIPDLRSRYPSVNLKLSGQSEEQQNLVIDLLRGALLAIFLIYALMAIPLRSYLQPLIIMSVIPFGVIGAIIGHWIFGKPVSMLSYFGLIALAGVVVNDSLIMVDFVNKAVRRGEALRKAAEEAGVKRFRAILLTSLTTFFGLVPIVLEESLQAQIVIPMALSLAFGILFATVITLFLVPSLYLILEDVKAFFRGESGVERLAREEGLDLFDGEYRGAG